MQVFADLKFYKVNSVILFSLMTIGLTVFILAMSFVETTQFNCDSLIVGTYTGDFVATPVSSENEFIVDEEQLDMLRKIKGIDEVARRIYIPTMLRMNGETTTATMIALEKTGSERLCDNFELDSERFFMEENMIAINRTIADAYSIREGDMVDVMTSGGKKQMRVYAVFDPRYTSSALDTWCVISYDTGVDLLKKDRGYCSELLVFGGEECFEELQKVFSETAEVKRWEDTSASSLAVAPVIWRFVLIGMMSFLFLIICAGCASLSSSSLLERTRDIAVLKTMGKTTQQVTLLYLGEVLVLFALSSVTAGGLAVLITGIVNQLGLVCHDLSFTFVFGSPFLTIRQSVSAFVLPICLCLVFCLMIMYMPVYKVCRKKIIEILTEN